MSFMKILISFRVLAILYIFRCSNFSQMMTFQGWNMHLRRRIIKCLVVSTVLLFPFYLWKGSIDIKHAIFTFRRHKYCVINILFNTCISNWSLFMISKEGRNMKFEVATNAVVLPSVGFNYNKKWETQNYKIRNLWVRVFYFNYMCVFRFR
jgi:hypothetical protein